MLLLHTCCADCGLKILAAIHRDPVMKDEAIHLYYYNPNIHPQSEFTARELALQKVAGQLKLKLIIANWTPEDYFQAMQGLDDIQIRDKTKRCPLCWQLRLSKTFDFAKENGYSHATSTLLSSKYSQKGVILDIGAQFYRKTGVVFYQPPAIDCNLKTAGFYKQNYCGCVYSLMERLREKYGNTAKWDKTGQF
jgi:predicted adenine nucleotide alpha hydrolase (AANH) superfamily ATPase